jgi:cysteine desulfurase/selenocysteine lyase
MDFIKIKNEFPVFKNTIDGKKLIYFDNACTVLKPKSVIETMNNYYQNLGVCSGDRSSHQLSWQVQELVEQAREKVREFINASSTKEIIWTKNTTEGINLIASSFPFKKPKNEVILTLLEHHSNLLPFYEQARRRNFKIKIIIPNKDGSLDLNLFKKTITDKTALVAVTHLSNVTGLIYPIKEIISLAHQKGAKVLVDDAQYIATHREDVQKNQMDFIVFSGHKIGGPTGIGVLYGRESFLKNLLPYNVGGGTVQSVKIHGNDIKVQYLPPPAGFEAGIQDYAGIIGLKAAVNFLEKQNQKEIADYIEKLSHYAFEQLKKLPEINFLVDYQSQKPSTLISFYFSDKKISLFDFNLYLNNELKDYFVAVRCGYHCAQPLHQFFGTPISMRTSFFTYNSKGEIDIFIQALEDFLSRKK